MPFNDAGLGDDLPELRVSGAIAGLSDVPADHPAVSPMAAQVGVVEGRAGLVIKPGGDLFLVLGVQSLDRSGVHESRCPCGPDYEVPEVLQRKRYDV